MPHRDSETIRATSKGITIFDRQTGGFARQATGFLSIASLFSLRIPFLLLSIHRILSTIRPLLKFWLINASSTSRDS